MLYRYDRLTPGYERQIDIYPKYWQYDLTNDIYGTLPNRLIFDAHTQIAPGLVTVYDESIDMATDTSASFRLYEYIDGNPKDLTLNYKRVAGMYVNAEPVGRVKLNSAVSDDLVTVQPFSMYFSDQYNNDEQTATSKYIKSLTGKTPVILSTPPEVTPYETYISSSALDAFSISMDVPEELQTLVSYDEIIIYKETDSEDTTPEENNNADNPENNNSEEPENNNENAQTAQIKIATDSDDIVEIYYTTDSSNNMAVLPFAVRMKVQRNSQLLSSIWEQLEAAESSQALFNIFSQYCAVWVRSSATVEYDTNLFRAINRKGASLGVSASDCVSAFIDGDYLYLDFMIFIADAVSQKASKSAFIEIFEDDGVPYIMIGDGEIDKRFELTFYLDKDGENPGETSTTSNVSNNEVNNNVSSHGSGGSCNAGFSFILLGLAFLMKKKI